MAATQPSIGHPVVTQGRELGQAELDRVVAKDIRNPPINLFLLPSEGMCALPREGPGQPVGGGAVLTINALFSNHMTMPEVLSLAAFADNYIWVLRQGTRSVVVDPGDPEVVAMGLRNLGVSLDGILVTHHHADHTGGVQALRKILQGPIYGPAREAIAESTIAVREGDRFDLLGHRVTVLDVPGHTLGHVAYLMEPDGQDPILFCGDTLFSGGCGRLFEGTAAQMHGSLSKLLKLNDRTRVCCAHEYTLANLRFARQVEPGNPDLADHERRCTTLRAHGEPTLPSTIEIERRINPFLRCQVDEVVRSALARGAAGSDPVDVFAALRQWKDRT